MMFLKTVLVSRSSEVIGAFMKHAPDFCGLAFFFRDAEFLNGQQIEL